MKKNIILFIGIFIVFRVSAQFDQVIQAGKIKSLSPIDHGVLIRSENALMMILVYTPDVIRIRLSQFDFADDFSYAVIQQPSGNFNEIREDGGEWQLTTDSLKIFIDKNSLALRFFNLKNQVISEDYRDFAYTWQGTAVSCYKKVFAREKFIGLGEKTGNLDRRGCKYEMWNADVPAYGVNEDPLYVSIPFYMGIHDQITYGIFLDNTFRTHFDFAASSDNRFSWFSAANGEMNYYFFGAPSIARIIEDYTWLTGRMKMPPLWSLGYQQCRWSYFPETEVLSLAQKFRDKKIPCDVIYLDIDYMDSYKIFTWNKDRFPNPGEMIKKLNNMGFHLATIVDPGIKIQKGYLAYDEGVKNDFFVKYPDGSYYTGNVWPGRCHFPDFTNELVRKWWGNSFSSLTEPGVEGFWNDMNEPSTWGQNIPDIVQLGFDGHQGSMTRGHNIYGLNMARATFEGTTALMSGKRPFILSRAGFAGIQRYSAVWTGDNEATDDHMLLSCRMVNSMGLSGIAFAGPDLGGFMGNPTKELYQRWLNIGVFTPFFRNHSAWDTKAKEPWSFGKEVENLSIELISLRYKLLPYIYSAFYQSSQNGLPVARTLAINYTYDEKIWDWSYQNQYMFGDNLLVAPVSSTQNFVKVYLPSGGWYRMSTGQFFQGGHEVIVDAPLHDLPVFIRASGLIPMQSVIQFTDQKPSPVLELHIYYGTQPNTFIYYEDDGTSYKYENGGYYQRDITFNPAERKIRFEKPKGSYPSKFSSIRLILHAFHDVMAVRSNSLNISLKLQSDGTRAGECPLFPSEFELTY